MIWLNIDANVQKAINSLIKKWKLLILFALIGALAAFIITANFTTLTYTSSIEFLAYAVDSDQELTESATLASSQSASSQRTSNTSKINYAMKMLDTYIEIFSTNNFNQSVADTLNRTYGTDYSAASIKNSIVISQIENTAMFVFEITTTDADLSYHIAQTLQKCVPETMANTNQGLVLAELQDSPQRAAAAESMQYPKKPYRRVNRHNNCRVIRRAARLP